MISDKGIHRLAIVVSVLLHILVLIIIKFNLNPTEKIKPEPVIVEYKIKEIITNLKLILFFSYKNKISSTMTPSWWII